MYKEELKILTSIITDLENLKKMLEENPFSLDYVLAAAFVSEAADNLVSRLGEIKKEEMELDG